MDNFRKGDLVKIVGIFEKENLTGVIVSGPYPAVFTTEEDGVSFSEESLAVDIMCSGRIYQKVKCNFLRQVSLNKLV